MAVDYDYIIVGLGAAGMSLAYYLAQSKHLTHKQVLILEKDPKNQNDRTWTFWGTPPDPIPSLIKKTWYQVKVKYGKQAVKLDNADMAYHYLPAIHFYEALLPAIQTHPNMNWHKESVTAIDQDGETAYVTTEQGTYSAKMVFNSAYPFTSALAAHKDEIFYQRFKGWEVVFDQPVLDQKCLTLMDFDLPFYKDFRFMYCLPLTANRLILNATVFGKQALNDDCYEQAMAGYLDRHYPGMPYRIERREGGIIPMSHLTTNRYWGEKVVNMGIIGGDTRSSTGYTFLYAVRFARKLAYCLEHETPFPSDNPPKRVQFYDNLFLQLLSDSPANLRRSMLALFAHNKAKRIFRFLDGSSRFWEEVRLVMTLPFAPFLKALFKQWKQKTRQP